MAREPRGSVDHGTRDSVARKPRGHERRAEDGSLGDEPHERTESSIVPIGSRC